jgi:DNA-binding Lrp family transcriptional regulator
MRAPMARLVVRWRSRWKSAARRSYVFITLGRFMCMDALDMRLLRTMGTGAFEHGPRHPDALKPAGLARAVGTTRQTVEARLARLEERGILQGYDLYPNLRHLGLEWAIYHFRAPDPESATRCFEGIDATNGVAGVYSFLTPDVCVDIYWASEEERAAELAGVSPHAMYKREMPPVRRVLSRLDWRILQALRGDARKSPEAVGAEVGVSARTVKRRLEEMARDNAFDVCARVALENAPYTIPLAFLLRFGPEAGRETSLALMREFDERCLSAWVPPAAALGDYDMLLYAESMAEIEALRKRAQGIAGVKEVHVLPYSGGRVDVGWLDRLIQERVERPEKPG